MAEKARRRFLIDAMLKNVASWLRILGYDAAYWSGDDRGVLRLASESGRTILTMDRGLAASALKRGLDVILVRENDVARILADLASRYGLSLDFDPASTRCPVCNHPLILRPEGGREEWVCGGCGKKYWRGSHWKNISRTLERARRLAGKK